MISCFYNVKGIKPSGETYSAQVNLFSWLCEIFTKLPSLQYTKGDLLKTTSHLYIGGMKRDILC